MGGWKYKHAKIVTRYVVFNYKNETSRHHHVFSTKETFLQAKYWRHVSWVWVVVVMKKMTAFL